MLANVFLLPSIPVYTVPSVPSIPVPSLPSIPVYTFSAFYTSTYIYLQFLLYQYIPSLPSIPVYTFSAFYTSTYIYLQFLLYQYLHCLLYQYIPSVPSIPVHSQFGFSHLLQVRKEIVLTAEREFDHFLHLPLPPPNCVCTVFFFQKADLLIR